MKNGLPARLKLRSFKAIEIPQSLSVASDL